MPIQKPSFLQVECKTSPKSAYVKAAAAGGGLKLNDWVLKVLDAELKKKELDTTNDPAT